MKDLKTATAKKAVAKKPTKIKPAIIKPAKTKESNPDLNVIAENDIVGIIELTQKGFDPKGRAVTLEVIEGGFLVQKENVEHWKMTFTKDEYNNAELWFVHAVDCSHN